MDEGKDSMMNEAPEAPVTATASAETVQTAEAVQESVAGKGWLDDSRIDPKSLNLKEEVVSLNRTAKVVKGGRRFSFSALVVVGDSAGHVGVGFGKAKEVPEAISKGAEDAKKNLIRVPLIGRTIAHAIYGEFSAARVMLKPASEGTGLIAGPAVRAVLSLAGIRDILTKCIGTNNKINVVKATVAGLASLQSAEKLAKLRGKTVDEVLGRHPRPVAPPAPDYDTSQLEKKDR